MSSFTNKIKAVVDKIKGLSSSRANIDYLGKKITEVIYRRVKSGRGVSSLTGSANPQGLKPLSKSYIAWRKGLVLFFRTKKNKKLVAVPKKKMNFKPPVLGEYGSPGKSNLTLSGQMLKAIEYRVKPKAIEMFINKKTRSKVRPNEKPLTNEQVAAYVQKERPFFALTEGEIRIIKRDYRNRLRSQI